MSFHDPEYRAAQAGEYVLGTLNGDDMNKKFQHDSDLNALVLEWQEKLQPLAHAIEPAVPPKVVWTSGVFQ